MSEKNRTKLIKYIKKYPGRLFTKDDDDERVEKSYRNMHIKALKELPEWMLENMPKMFSSRTSEVSFWQHNDMFLTWGGIEQDTQIRFDRILPPYITVTSGYARQYCIKFFGTTENGQAKWMHTWEGKLSGNEMVSVRDNFMLSLFNAL